MMSLQQLTQISGITTEEDCKAIGEVCIDSLGTLDTLSQDQCEANRHCSQHCPGESCQSVFGQDICLSYDSKETCTGSWNTEKVR